jgi:LAS superfamily LD-carboxypeptidase LdcB
MKIWSAAMLLSALAFLLSCGGKPEASTPSSPVTLAKQSLDLPQAPAIDSPEVQVDTFSKELLLGKVDPAKDADFVPIAAKYTSKTGIFMRKEAYAAFEQMHAAAKAEGLDLKIISATRPFGAQKTIWENKWTGVTIVGGKNLSTAMPDPVERAKAILRYSSMPGTSRHHWGTDIDLNNLENSYFESGQGKKIYEWLVAHAGEYGFCQPYSPMGDARPHGYQEEKWHWSYLPLAEKYLKAYQLQVQLSDIQGFKGAETAQPLNVIEHYVSGISQACKN